MGISGSRILDIAKSKSGALIRLTVKQWEHITAARPELASFMPEILMTVAKPDEVFAPPERIKPQLHALRKVNALADIGFSQNLVVIYRETSLQEGFIITAFPINERRKRRMYRLWQKM